MLFMIFANDAPDSSERRQETRPRHLDYLQQLENEKRLVLAGPMPLPDDATRVSGSLIVADFASLEAAQQWAENDPYALAGVYAEVLIRPFRQVFPA